MTTFHQEIMNWDFKRIGKKLRVTEYCGGGRCR